MPANIGCETLQRGSKNRPALQDSCLRCRMGKLKPYVFKTFKLEEAGKAEQALAEQHVQGKIVLTVNR